MHCRHLLSRSVNTITAFVIIFLARIQDLHPEELRSARQAARLTQQPAAARLGVSQPYLALMERGRRQVTARFRPKIVKLYGHGPAALPLETDCLESARGLRRRRMAMKLIRTGREEVRKLPRDLEEREMVAAEDFGVQPGEGGG